MFAGRRGPICRWSAIASLLLVPVAQASRPPKEPPVWILDFTHGHVAYLRIADETETGARPAELRIAYKDPLSTDGGDVMVFELRFSCTEMSIMTPEDVLLVKGELWKRDPATHLAELGPEQFDALRGKITLAKAWVVVCEPPGFDRAEHTQVKVPRLTQTYFGLLQQDVHYQVALALANVPNSDDLPKGQLQAFDIPQEKRSTVMAILKWRNLPLKVPQAAP